MNFTFASQSTAKSFSERRADYRNEVLSREGQIAVERLKSGETTPKVVTQTLCAMFCAFNPSPNFESETYVDSEGKEYKVGYSKVIMRDVIVPSLSEALGIEISPDRDTPLDFNATQDDMESENPKAKAKAA